MINILTCLKCRNNITNSVLHCTYCGWKPEVIDDYIAFCPELAIKNTHFNPETFHLLATLESGNFWFTARNKLINMSINKFFPNANNLLEIGCGTGFVLSNIKTNFPKLSIYGSDIYVTSLMYAQNRLGSESKLFQMDATNIPFINQFDLIGAFDVLEHITEDTLVLQQIYLALKDNGMVILTVPQHPWLWSNADTEACHVRRYKINELQNKLQNAGFKIKMSSSFVFFIFPLMIFARLLNKRENNIKKELSLNKILNFMFKQILNLEILLIKFGLKFPIGGSRFIVAMK